MSLVLVDTSVWIGFFRNLQNAPLEKLNNLLDNGGPVCTCPIIVEEVLQGISDPKLFDFVQQLLLQQIVLKCDPVQSSIEAARIFQMLRRKGITIRSSADCMIAYHAMFYESALLHLDKDFSKIASVLGLKMF